MSLPTVKPSSAFERALPLILALVGKNVIVSIRTPDLPWAASITGTLGVSQDVSDARPFRGGEALTVHGR